MDEMNDWDRISKALFGPVPMSPSPGFTARVMANLRPAPLPWSWLAPAFAAGAAALVLIASTGATVVSAEELLLDEEPPIVLGAVE